ncbi:MAG: hypothetical protein FWD13_08240, partial [Treponema sp.]|nr:hypothetical protein [Treponema sp.]
LEVIEAARRQKYETNGNNDKQPQADSILLDSFIRDANKAAVWLKEQSSQFDNEEVLRKFTVIVHGIKSSLWNIGETLLADTALNLENAGRERNIELIKKTTPGFLSDIIMLLEKFESKRIEYGTDDDIEGLCSKFKTIMEMCSNYDRKGALDTAAEITYCSKETKEILDKIIEFVIHSEFEEAYAVAEAYMDVLHG